MATADANPIKIGKVVGDAFDAVLQNAGAYLALSAIFILAPTIVIHLVAPVPSGPLADQGDVLRATYIQVGVESLFSYPFVGGVTASVLAQFDGKRLSFQECVTRGLQLWAPLLAFNLIVGSIQLVAFLALIIPGLVLSLIWAVAVPVRIAEQRDIRKSLARSQALTKGRRGSIIVLVLIIIGIALGVLLIAAMLRIGVSAIVGVSDLPLQAMVQSMFAAVSQTALQLTIAAVLASLYQELRATYDGGSPAIIAETFS